MNPSEMALLRTKLREVNIEYSALLRKKVEEQRYARMGELRAERQALMALIMEQRGHATGEQLRVPPNLGVLRGVPQAAAEQGSARPV